MLYPLKFVPIIKQTIWGGEKLAYKSNNPDVCDNIGESWELSGVQENISVVAEGVLEGNSLEELSEIYMGDLLGDKVYEKFGVEFPLLIKFIDACDYLSIQVHPDDNVAKQRHKAYGKTEMWYLLESDPKAKLIMGFKENSSKSEYLTSLNNGQLESILNVENVKEGDCFFIPAGTVHAIGAGCFIAEIQQTSDITYRIYDFNRRDKDGNERELHTELATDVICYDKQDDLSVSYKTELNATQNLVDCKYFTTNIISFDNDINKDYIEIDSFVVYICLKGEFDIYYQSDLYVNVKQGETILLPACLKNIYLKPKVQTELLEVYVTV